MSALDALGFFGACLLVMGATAAAWMLLRRFWPQRAARRAAAARHDGLDALARAAGVMPPDGSHDDMPDVDGQQWAAELMWLHEQMPEAVLLERPRLEGGPPVVPGRGEGGS